jgi:anti-sigma regulatory factor (Ser/Thr protein kinase)
MTDVLSLDAVPESPRLARRFVTERLHRWHYDPLVSTAALVTSEIVTNAVVHARSRLVLGVEDQGDGVLLTVEDPEPTLPVPRDATPDDTGGRGLAIVAALAAEWGIELVPGGKRVWCRLALHR